MGVLVAMSVYIVVRGSWEPSRIVFSTERTARALAALCVGTSALTIVCIVALAGFSHGAWALSAVAAGLAVNAVMGPVFLFSRLRAGAHSDEIQDGPRMAL
jgi:hypothetical protein